MSDDLTPFDVTQEIAEMREHAEEFRKELAAIPQRLADRLTPVQLAYVTEAFEAEVATIFAKFESDLVKLEDELLGKRPTED